MLLIPEQVNQQNGGVRVGEQWYNLSKSRGNNPGYQGPPLEVGVQYDMEINPHTFPNGDEAFFIQSAKVDVAAALANAPSPYQEAEGAAKQRVTAGAQRDETRVSIERQVCLKAAAELWNGIEGWSADEVKATATTFYDWVSDTSVPPSETTPAAAPPPEYRG